MLNEMILNMSKQYRKHANPYSCLNMIWDLWNSGFVQIRG